MLFYGQKFVEPPKVEVVEAPSHEPVVRKKACYYELQGSDTPAGDMERLVKQVADRLGSSQDQESGEVSTRKSDDGSESMPYQAFVHFMEKVSEMLVCRDRNDHY